MQPRRCAGCTRRRIGARAVLEARGWPPLPTPATLLACTAYLAFLRRTGLSPLPCCCSFSSHPPQPCSERKFKNHLLHAVFPELLCNREYCLLWTCEPPNLSSAHPFQRVPSGMGIYKDMPKQSSHFLKLAEIWILCSRPERHGHLRWALGLHSGVRRNQHQPNWPLCYMVLGYTIL